MYECGRRAGTTPGLAGNGEPLDGKMISPLASKVKRSNAIK